MNDSLVASAVPAIPPEVEEFAAARGLSGYLPAVIELARQALPASSVRVSLACDAEDETHQYIAVDVAASDRTAKQLLAGQCIWSAGLGRVCPARYAVHFVLGWQ